MQGQAKIAVASTASGVSALLDGAAAAGSAGTGPTPSLAQLCSVVQESQLGRDAQPKAKAKAKPKAKVVKQEPTDTKGKKELARTLSKKEI